MELDPIKILKCKECGVDVPVNAKYPITEVGCNPRYCPKPDKK
jgi:hypothetical protein